MHCDDELGLDCTDHHSKRMKLAYALSVACARTLTVVTSGHPPSTNGPASEIDDVAPLCTTMS